ncbi:putative protoporphyrinogen oxidase [Methanocella paludicola SANAE]|uniref:Protoporphyrinogen oxidase n=1 Tax=Methanocella paludicola (strain DSM 17711 / JCM 13418 / NBRC 101707 / SANAE) TaxID=304371 RepID=D1YX14_METPS|nr:flavodoxin domain-containing protein [Methanocella paludicola]BAI60986.1 putative protoporphyrinogen oxidase [Methanocella paludicola SANAE]
MKALVIYGTRGGATKQIAEEIGKILGEQGFEVSVDDAKKSKSYNVNEYDLIVVGSSVWATYWKWQATRFMRRNAKKLMGKKVALFSSGLAGGDPTQKEYAHKSIETTAAKFPWVKPIALAYFGGYVDFEHPTFFASFMANAMKKDFEKKGQDTSKPYDTRDFSAIRQWALDVAAKARV